MAIGCGRRRRVKTVFLSHLYIKRSFYQDRLGTNIGKALKKGTVFPQAEAEERARAAVIYPSDEQLEIWQHVFSNGEGKNQQTIEPKKAQDRASRPRRTHWLLLIRTLLCCRCLFADSASSCGMQAVARSALEAAEQKAAARRARKARQNEQEIQREVILSRRFGRFLRFETNSVLRFSLLSLMLMSAYSTLKVKCRVYPDKLRTASSAQHTVWREA